MYQDTEESVADLTFNLDRHSNTVFLTAVLVIALNAQKLPYIKSPPKILSKIILPKKNPELLIF